MTPERLGFLLEHFRARCTTELTPAEHRDAVATFLHYSPRTMSRWRDGELPIPHLVAMIAELMYGSPITMDFIQRRLKLEAVDEDSTELWRALIRVEAAAQLASLMRHRWDLRTGEIEWDPAIRVAFGFRMDAVITRDMWIGQLQPRERSRVEAASDRAMRGDNGGIYDLEYSVTDHNGVRRRLRSRGQVVFNGNTPLEFCGMTRISSP
jgi:PAS domain-containing protein